MNMDMTNNVPGWLTPIAWIFIASAIISAVIIAVDIYAQRRRDQTFAAGLVWVTSALYLGPFALILYTRHGRHVPADGSNTARAAATVHNDDTPMTHPNPAVSALPGGGASAVAHLIGVPLVVASGLTIAGIDLWVMILVIGVLAMMILFGLERGATRAGDRRMSATAAAGVAVATVLAFDIGMGGWMLLLHFNEFMPPTTQATFWFLMQVGIILGLGTGYPVVKTLARRHAVDNRV